MSFGGRDMKKGREKGGNVKGQGKKGKEKDKMVSKRVK
jgi:hypothetical protein